MHRERLLVAATVTLLAASAVTAVAVPGVIADRDPDDIRPGRADIQEVTIGVGDVSAGTVTLSVTTYLAHRDGESENLSLRVRAVGVDSGMVKTTREVAVDPISGDREVPVVVDLPVARDGGYRIETVLYDDENRVGAVATAVRGVGTVQAGGHVEFHRFGADLPPVQYSVAETAPNRTTLAVSTYLTNRGAEPSGPVSVELVVRQAESNIVAARSTVSVDGVAAGATVTPNASVTVPAGYNYYLDAILRKDGVIVDTARSAANLDPQERIEADTTVRDVGLRVEEFERTDTTERSPERPAEETGASGVPGFGPAVAVAALVAVTVLTWRRQT